MQTTVSVPPEVLTVSELNQSVARLLERTIPLCWIAGEVSNFTRAASGHWYFTLKDDQAQVKAVMFKSRSIAAEFIPREGEKVEVRATVTLYAARGDFQLCVEGIRRAGLGNLYEAFLKLKQKLSEAGLLDAARKKKLPSFPRCIGIVTSPQAAALRDVLITLQRRAPHVKVVIYPTPVQGNGSALKIVQAIGRAVSRNECDILLVVRGGGSIEDLWSFNDEQLAYAVAACPIAVVAGVGHETDFTIVDFVADLRAPTPTAAAELAVSARTDLLLQLESLTTRLRRSLRRRLDQYQQTVDTLTHRLISPIAAVRHAYLKLSGMKVKIVHAFQHALQQTGFHFEQLKQRLIRQTPNITHHKDLLDQRTSRLQEITHRQIALHQQALSHLSSQLELLNPQRTLERGYAIVMDQKGKILRKPAQFPVPGNITVRLADGEVDLGIVSAQPRI